MAGLAGLWWPATVLYFGVACGELIYNATATKPAVTAFGLLATPAWKHARDQLPAGRAEFAHFRSARPLVPNGT